MTQALKIHVEIYLAEHMLQREQGPFSPSELVARVRKEFGDTRPGVQAHATSHCVANKALHTAYVNNYLWNLGHGRYRCFDPAQDTPHPERVAGPAHIMPCSRRHISGSGIFS